jgi:phage terminase small subunit
VAEKPGNSAKKMFVLPKPPKPPRPPAGLSAVMRKWWGQTVRDYALESHHLLLLEGACRSWDLARRARAVLDRDGLTYLDRWKQPRVRAEVAVEHQAKIAFARLLRELSLDVSAPDASRPPGLYNGERGR